jgi:hypothetical protein
LEAQKKANKNDEAGINQMMKVLGFSPQRQKKLSTKALSTFANLNRIYLLTFANGEERKKKTLDRATIIRLIKLAYYKATNQNTVCVNINWHVQGSSRNKHQTKLCPPYNWFELADQEEEEREGPECDPFFPPVPERLRSPVKRKLDEIESESEIEATSEEQSEDEATSVASENDDDDHEDPFEFDDD